MPRSHQSHKVDETPSEDDEREECPAGTSCEKRHNILHHGKYKHLKITALVEPPSAAERGAADPNDPSVPPPSDDDEREECPEGTGCGIRSNVLHRHKYKHVTPTLPAGRRHTVPHTTSHSSHPTHHKTTAEKLHDLETASDDDEREECAKGTGCRFRHNHLHRNKYKHTRITPHAENQYRGIEEASDDDEREECVHGTACRFRHNVLHSGKYKHIRISAPEERQPTGNEEVSEDDEREECPAGTGCPVRSNVLHRKKYKHVKVTSVQEPKEKPEDKESQLPVAKEEIKEAPGTANSKPAVKKSGSTEVVLNAAESENEKNVPPPSPDDQREECAAGTGCGMRTNTLHRHKYKHIKPTPVVGKKGIDYRILSDDDEREECPYGSACEKRRNGRHRAKYKHIRLTQPSEFRKVKHPTNPPDVPSEDDERLECPEGTGCGMRGNYLHRGKYKHIRITQPPEDAPETKRRRSQRSQDNRAQDYDLSDEFIDDTGEEEVEEEDVNDEDYVPDEGDIQATAEEAAELPEVLEEARHFLRSPKAA